jgi:hypothetical protein
VVEAIIGDLAEPYAAFLQGQGHNWPAIETLTPQNLRQLGVNDQHTVEVRRVGVAGSGLYAYGLCSSRGRVLGVRKRHGDAQWS